MLPQVNYKLPIFFRFDIQEVHADSRQLNDNEGTDLIWESIYIVKAVLECHIRVIIKLFLNICKQINIIVIRKLFDFTADMN